VSFPVPRILPKKPAVGEGFPDLRPLAGWDILYLPKFIMIVFLRWFFSEAVPGFIWNADDSKSDVDIIDKHTTYKDGIHQKPRIVVDRGSLQWMNTSISNTLGTNSQAIAQFSPGGAFLGFSTTGGSLFQGSSFNPGGDIVSDLFQGRLNIQCFAEEGLVADRLAALVYTAIRVHRPQLKQMGFFSVDTEAVGSESLVFHTSNTRWIGTPVTVKYWAEFTARTSARTDDAGLEQFQCESDRPPKIILEVAYNPRERCTVIPESEDEEG